MDKILSLGRAATPVRTILNWRSASASLSKSSSAAESASEEEEEGASEGSGDSGLALKAASCSEKMATCLRRVCFMRARARELVGDSFGLSAHTTEREKKKILERRKWGSG